ncbi:uncharacterized protein LOC115318693, partial [Ixodes scapularis]|uniref:uncharacterized protein LOC115318693 n=1 Tax=Ixodes scapularis TaxID=6945 RepID=UPI001A9F468F
MSKSAGDATEFLWQSIRPHLPTKKDKVPSQAGKFTILGDITIPPDVGKRLEVGPKFCYEPVLSPPELVTLAKKVAYRTVEEDRPRCISECVDNLQLPQKRGPVGPFRPLVEYMVTNGLRVLLSDKEGHFVVLPDGQYNEKARAAIEKNFRPVQVALKKTRDKAKNLCERLALTQLAARVGKAERLHLEVFFSVKTHKEACPFRAIVTEKGSWQKQVAFYLQKQLSALSIRDPFRVANSEEIVEYLRLGGPEKRTAFSIDVENLFYSLPHDQLLTSVKDCIEANGELAFRSSSGVPIESFMELLQFYLNSMIVGWRDGCYLQKSGVCIGSCVAPVLSDIYLGAVDCVIESALEGKNVNKVARYVDDFLVILQDDERMNIQVADIMETFAEYGGGLKFTFEVPKENILQYLDLSLHLGDTHVCWSYSPRSKKAILDYGSAHSKIIKRGIALTCLGSALRKSCRHTMSASFTTQVERLTKAGYSSALLADVANALVKKAKGFQSNKTSVKQTRPVVIPYLHRMSHNLKNVASRYGVRVVFSAPQKMSQICNRVNAHAEGTTKPTCTKKHANEFLPCASGVVYKIPLSCGKSYIGQTGRCLNDRLREHDYSLKATVGGNLPLHCRECTCRPLFRETNILGKNKDKLTREVLEAFYILREDRNCISVESVTLTNKERKFLEQT